MNRGRSRAGLYYDEFKELLFVGGGNSTTGKLKSIECWDLNKDCFYSLPNTNVQHGYYPILWRQHDLLYIASYSTQSQECIDLRVPFFNGGGDDDGSVLDIFQLKPWGNNDVYKWDMGDFRNKIKFHEMGFNQNGARCTCGKLLAKVTRKWLVLCTNCWSRVKAGETLWHCKNKAAHVKDTLICNPCAYYSSKYQQELEVEVDQAKKQQKANFDQYSKQFSWTLSRKGIVEGFLDKESGTVYNEDACRLII